MIKRGGILAVAALVALTGCSASPSEPLTAETQAPVSVSVSPDTAEVEEARAVRAAQDAEATVSSVDLTEQTENQFVEFALMRASSHGVAKKPSEKSIVAALHAFCEDGKPFKISNSAAYSNSLEAFASNGACDKLAE